MAEQKKSKTESKTEKLDRLGNRERERRERKEENNFILFFMFNLNPKWSIYEIPNTGLINAAWQPSLLLDLC